MSIILDALARAQKERGDTASSVGSENLPVTRSRSAVWFGIGLLTIVLVAVASWSFLRAPPDETTVSAEPFVVWEEEQPAPARSVHADEPAAPSRAESTQGVTAEPEAPPPIDLSEPLEQPEPTAQVAADDPVVDSMPALPPAPSAAQPSQSASEPLAALPSAARSGIRLPAINVHVWHEQAERRFVLLDMQRYAEGDSLGDGVSLVAIVPEGLVVERQGQRFLHERRR